MSDELGGELRRLVEGAPAADPAAVVARGRRRRRRRAIGGSLAVVIIAGGVAAIASSSNSEPRGVHTIVEPTTPGVDTSTVPAPTSTARPPRTTTSVTIPIATPVTTEPVQCTRAPVAHVQYQLGGPNMYEQHPVTLNYPTGAPGVGNGNGGRTFANGAMVRAAGDNAVQIVTSRGTATFTASPYLRIDGAGDFDGDGRHDAIVSANSPSGTEVTQFIVLGSTPPGSYPVASVGIPLTHPSDGYGYFANVGDQDRDGADDLSVGVFLYWARRWSQRMGAHVTPFRKLMSNDLHEVARYQGLLQLDQSGPPTFVVVDAPGTAAILLTTPPQRLLLTGTSQAGFGNVYFASRADAIAWRSGGHRMLELSYDDRDGIIGWTWDLDARCTSPG